MEAPYLIPTLDLTTNTTNPSQNLQFHTHKSQLPQNLNFFLSQPFFWVGKRYPETKSGCLNLSPLYSSILSPFVFFFFFFFLSQNLIRFNPWISGTVNHRLNNCRNSCLCCSRSKENRIIITLQLSHSFVFLYFSTQYYNLLYSLKIKIIDIAICCTVLLL